MAVAGDGAPIVQRGPEIAVLARGKAIWRSRGRFRARGVFAIVGRDAVAFSYESYFSRREQIGLYVAQRGAAERRIAENEQPLGWTADDKLLSWRFEHGFSWLYLRDSRGRLQGRVSSGLREIRFDQAIRTVLAISRSGVLERYRSGRWSPIVKLAALGLDVQSSFERLAGGLVGLVDGLRVAVLKKDGSLFASARFDSGNVAGESGLVANGAGTAVAFVVTRGRPSAPIGHESVQLLHAGDRRAETLQGGRVPGALCGRWATLAWHRKWLLYSVTGGKTLLVNTANHARRLDLTRLMHKLAPHSNLRSIAWA
jgi:hypothetical protein